MRTPEFSQMISVAIVPILFVSAACADEGWVSVKSRIDREKQPTFLIRYGLLRDDVKRLEALQDVDIAVPIRAFEAAVRRLDVDVRSRVVGTVPDMLRLPGGKVANGRFLTQQDVRHRQNVCVIGERIAESHFEGRSPLGQHLQINDQVFTVVGVLNEGKGGESAVASSSDVYIPITTMRSRFGDIVIERRSGSFSATSYEISQFWLRSKSSHRRLRAATETLLQRLGRTAQTEVSVWQPKDN